MADSASKRRRLSWGSSGKPSPGAALQLVPSTQHEQQDIIEFFAQRGERKKELEAQVQALESNAHEMQARLAKTEATVAQQKDSLITERAQKTALEHMLQEEKDLMESVVRREMEKAASLQVDLATARQQKGEAQAAKETADSRLAEAERTARRKCEELDSRAARLEAQLHQQALDTDDYRRRSEAEIRRQQQLIAMAEQATRQVEGQLQEAEKLAEGAAQRRRQAEAQVAALQAELEAAHMQRSAQSDGDGGGESATAFQLRMLQDLVQKQEDEVKEARRLKSHVSKSVILVEQLQAAEARCRRLEATAAEQAHALAEREAQQRELQQWRSLVGDLPAEQRNPQALTRMLDELRARALALSEEASQHKAESLRLQGSLKAAETDARQASARQGMLEAAEAELSGTIARLERKVALLMKERTMLKEIVDSYDAEEAIHGGEAAQTPQKKRLDGLEAANARLSEHIARIEREAAQSAAALREHAQQVAAASERAAAAEAEVARLQAELEAHEKQIALLEARVGRGEYNPANTRVLHFVHNPEAEARREHEAGCISDLEAEAATLRAQLQALQQRPAGAEAAPEGEQQSVLSAVAAAEKTVLERKVKDLEKRESRLKEVFKTQVSNFREACYCLFGYRVDMASQAMPSGSGRGMPPTTFVLKPQHADVPSAQLLFKMEAQGGMALLPNDYVLQHLSREAETFITRFKSIPAFTANLTMENFQKQTRC